MNRKSIFNKFFVGLFFLITTLSSSHFSPENEIKIIETLPRKERVTLDIEVTKIKSQPIVGVLDKNNKHITINFSNIKNSKQYKIITEESSFSLFITNNLDNLSSYSSNKSKLNKKVFPKYTFEKIDDKVIKINFEEQPDKLYIIILNKNTDTIHNVFKVNIEESDLIFQTAPTDALLIEILSDAGKWESITNVIFDHGSIIKGQDIPEPIIYKNFRVRRDNNASLNTGNFNLTISDSEAPLVLNSDNTKQINHKFVSTIENINPANAIRNFKISSEIQSFKILDTLPAGTYGKKSDVIINITQ